MKLLRRLLVPVARFKKYDKPLIGWLGWYEVFGKCIAFRGVDGTLFVL